MWQRLIVCREVLRARFIRFVTIVTEEPAWWLDNVFNLRSIGDTHAAAIV